MSKAVSIGRVAAFVCLWSIDESPMGVAIDIDTATRTHTNN
jgi:hypothetical protein